MGPQNWSLAAVLVNFNNYITDIINFDLYSVLSFLTSCFTLNPSLMTGAHTVVTHVTLSTVMHNSYWHVFRLGVNPCSHIIPRKLHTESPRVSTWESNPGLFGTVSRQCCPWLILYCTIHTCTNSKWKNKAFAKCWNCNAVNYWLGVGFTPDSLSDTTLLFTQVWNWH